MFVQKKTYKRQCRSVITLSEFHDTSHVVLLDCLCESVQVCMIICTLHAVLLMRNKHACLHGYIACCAIDEK